MKKMDFPLLRLKEIDSLDVQKLLNSKLKRRNEIFIVDYLKHVIKNPKANCHQKFRALLLLKELIKTKNKPLVKYNALKFLHRQSNLALQGNDCLKKYTKKFNPQISADFHYLNLECLQRWRQTFAKYDKKYITEYDKLKPEQKGQLPTKFFNIPEEEHEMFQENQDIQMLNDDHLLKECELKMEGVQQIRQNFMKNLLKSSKENIRTPEIVQKFDHYQDEVNQMRNHLQDENIDRQLSKQPYYDQYQKEILFCDDFKGYFNSIDDNDPDRQQEFFLNIKNLNKSWLNESINIEPQLERIRERKAFKEVQKPDLNYEDNDLEFNNDVFVEQQIKDDSFKKDYEYPDVYEPEREEKFESVDPETLNQNKTLQQEVEELDRKRRNLLRDVQMLEDEHKENLTPTKKSYRQGLERGENDGLIQILKNKDRQIDDIQEKIKRIEREHDKLNEPDLEFDLDAPRQRNDYYQTPRKSRKSFREGRSNFKSNRSQSQLRNSRLHTKSIEKSLNRNAQHKNYEQSGTQFVNKMFNDIDRLINKNNHRLKRNNYQ